MGVFAVNDGVLIALIVFIGGLAATASPLLLAHVMNRSNRAMKEREWQRQDEVARRLEEAAASTLAYQSTIIANQKEQVTALHVVEDQNRVIHALVNSAYTASLEAQQFAVEGQITLMRELIEMKTVKDAADVEKVALLELKLEVLVRTIADRHRQQAIAEQENARALKGVDENGVPYPRRRRTDRRADDLPPPPPMEIEVPQTFTAEVTLKPQETEEPA